MIIVVLLLIFSISIGFYIYIRVTYNKYKNVKLKNGLSGFEVARKILDNHDLNNVYITESKKRVLSDYDINRKVIRLVNGVFNDETIVSTTIASFEAGEAVQDKKEELLFTIKKKIENFISLLLIVGYFIFLLGCFFGHVNTIIVGLIIIDLIVIYNIMLYTVDKKTAKIAIVELISGKIIVKSEYKKVEKLLKATSYTSLSSVILPIAKIIKKIIFFGDSNK